MRTPFHRRLRRGELVRSCIAAVARTDSGPAYRAWPRGEPVADQAKARRRTNEEEAARRRAIEEKEKARRKPVKDRAYAVFWSRTCLPQQRWKYFRALAELFFDRNLVFGAPDARYGDDRPVCERSGPDGKRWMLVGVACPTRAG